MPLTAYHFSSTGGLRRNLNREETCAAYASGEGLLWVDITETTEEDAEFLKCTFGFHNLAIEDCVSQRIHAPKIDDFGDHLFIIVHGINYMTESDIVETAELAIFIGSHFVVSNHNFKMYSVDHVKQQVEYNGLPIKRGADFLTHALIDTLIDNVMPTLDKMNEVADEIEEETIRNPNPATIDTILKFKRSISQIHRAMVPQRENMNRLSRSEFSLIGEDAQVFYRDIYDHVVRIEDMTHTLRDRADNTQSIYLASMANRQNEAMKVMAMVATIFLPMTLLAGIYGMNFENMPELKWPWGYFAVLGFMATVISILVWRFWANNWITWGRRQLTRVRPFDVDPENLMGYVSRFTKWPHL